MAHRIKKDRNSKTIVTTTSTSSSDHDYTGVTINGRPLEKSNRAAVYPFFLMHMGMFSISGFVMAYFADPGVAFLFMHGGFAIFVYTIFYHAIFGRDEGKWMFINAGLGIFGIYAQIGWLLGLFGKEISSYPLIVHIILFLYFVLYTFLIRQMFIDIIGARKHPERLSIANRWYVGVSLLVSVVALLAQAW